MDSKDNGKTQREVIEEATPALRETAKHLADFCRSLSANRASAVSQPQGTEVPMQQESLGLDKNLRILFDEIDEFYDGVITIRNALGGVHVNEVAVLEARSE